LQKQYSSLKVLQEKQKSMLKQKALELSENKEVRSPILENQEQTEVGGDHASVKSFVGCKNRQ